MIHHNDRPTRPGAASVEAVIAASRAAGVAAITAVAESNETSRRGDNAAGAGIHAALPLHSDGISTGLLAGAVSFWVCDACTFHNESREAPLCEMCGSPRVSDAFAGFGAPAPPSQSAAATHIGSGDSDDWTTSLSSEPPPPPPPPLSESPRDGAEILLAMAMNARAKQRAEGGDASSNNNSTAGINGVRSVAVAARGSGSDGGGGGGGNGGGASFDNGGAHIIQQEEWAAAHVEQQIELEHERFSARLASELADSKAADHLVNTLQNSSAELANLLLSEAAPAPPPDSGGLSFAMGSSPPPPPGFASADDAAVDAAAPSRQEKLEAAASAILLPPPPPPSAWSAADAASSFGSHPSRSDAAAAAAGFTPPPPVFDDTQHTNSKHSTAAAAAAAAATATCQMAPVPAPRAASPAALPRSLALKTSTDAMIGELQQVQVDKAVSASIQIPDIPPPSMHLIAATRAGAAKVGGSGSSGVGGGSYQTVANLHVHGKAPPSPSKLNPPAFFRSSSLPSLPSKIPPPTFVAATKLAAGSSAVSRPIARPPSPINAVPTKPVSISAFSVPATTRAAALLGKKPPISPQKPSFIATAPAQPAGGSSSKSESRGYTTVNRLIDSESGGSSLSPSSIGRSASLPASDWSSQSQRRGSASRLIPAPPPTPPTRPAHVGGGGGASSRSRSATPPASFASSALASASISSATMLQSNSIGGIGGAASSAPSTPIRSGRTIRKSPGSTSASSSPSKSSSPRRRVASSGDDGAVSKMRSASMSSANGKPSPKRRHPFLDKGQPPGSAGSKVSGKSTARPTRPPSRKASTSLASSSSSSTRPPRDSPHGNGAHRKARSSSASAASSSPAPTQARPSAKLPGAYAGVTVPSFLVHRGEDALPPPIPDEPLPEDDNEVFVRPLSSSGSARDRPESYHQALTKMHQSDSMVSELLATAIKARKAAQAQTVASLQSSFVEYDDDDPLPP